MLKSVIDSLDPPLLSFDRHEPSRTVATDHLESSYSTRGGLVPPLVVHRPRASPRDHTRPMIGYPNAAGSSTDEKTPFVHPNGPAFRSEHARWKRFEKNFRRRGSRDGRRPRFSSLSGRRRTL